MVIKKYIKKSSAITAIQFDGNSFYPGVIFRKDINTWQIYNKLHDSWINIKIGDYYRIDIEDDNYPIDREYMTENYIEVDE